MKVDLNCDLGESFGVYTIGNDSAILDYVTSANVACGFHAGDYNVMAKTVQMAKEKNVAIGAHPGFQDLIGFGRREIKTSSDDVFHSIIYQIGALKGFCEAYKVKLHHVKPHGALYNMAAKDCALAEAIVKAIKAIDPNLILYGLANSELIKMGNHMGIQTVSEVFADRTYQDDGSLTPRSNSNALIEDKDDAIAQVIQMVKQGNVTTTTGKVISINAETICIHGDGESALSFAKGLRTRLQLEGVNVVNKSGTI